MAWNAANDAVLAEGRRVLIGDPGRFDGLQVLGVDEHCRRHTRRGDKFVTVIIDLTAICDGTGPARLLDMVEGRSKQVFKTWLIARPDAWHDAVQVIATDWFTGFKTAAAEEIPDAVAVMTRSMSCASLARRTTSAAGGSSRTPTAVAAAATTRSTAPGGPLHTGAGLLTDKQNDRLVELFAADRAQPSPFGTRLARRCRARAR